MNEITLKTITKAIQDGTINRTDKNAEMVNYGTDGGVRYQQEAEINGERVMVYYDTTVEYDKACKRLGRINSLQSKNEHEDLDEEETEELDHLIKESEEENDYVYETDESYNCDWNNPTHFELLD